MTGASRGFILAVGSLILLGESGCAKSLVEDEPPPEHPFPSWVGELETGASRDTEVRDRFGEPDEIEASPRGGLVWRYAFSEFHWPEGDPDKPAVSANERDTSGEARSLAQIGRWFERVGQTVGNLILFPPAPPRPSRSRHLPARIHALELEFTPDGTLRRFRYAPREGRAPVPKSA